MSKRRQVGCTSGLLLLVATSIAALIDGQRWGVVPLVVSFVTWLFFWTRARRITRQKALALARGGPCDGLMWPVRLDGEGTAPAELRVTDVAGQRHHYRCLNPAAVPVMTAGVPACIYEWDPGDPPNSGG